MKEFFKKNDRYLHKAKLVLLIYTIVMAILIALLGICYCILDNVGGGIGLILGGAIGLPIFYFVMRLLLSYFIDIKLIRNKLYEKVSEGNIETHNDDLKSFYEN